MKESLFKGKDGELIFGILWFISSAIGGAVGHYWMWSAGRYLNDSTMSGLLNYLFNSSLSINSIVVGLLCANLAQGWLLSTRGGAFCPWAAVSAGGYVAGMTLTYVAGVTVPDLARWVLPLATVVVCALQAEHLRDRAHRPYAWLVTFPLLMVPACGLFLFFHFLFAMSANGYVSVLPLSLVVGMAVGIVATISLFSTKPTFQVDLGDG